ncbi:tetratricopeptide repeat protein [Aurantivibrio plasticivorans]
MKYVKPLRIFATISLCILSLVGCSSSKLDGWSYDGSSSVALADTSLYLPIQETDKTGVLLPYEAQPNPYSELSGRIDKEAVSTYIDARRAFNAKKYDFADQLLAQLVTAHPKLSGPWVMRGDIAAAQQNYSLAVQHYIEAIDVNDANMNAYLRLAKAQRQRGHFAHAQNTYALALVEWRDSPELHLNLGVLYDVYLNKPLQAQAHMEAYQLLTTNNDQQVTVWIDEIRGRTGVVSTRSIIGPTGNLIRLTDLQKSSPISSASTADSTQVENITQSSDPHADSIASSKVAN